MQVIETLKEPPNSAVYSSKDDNKNSFAPSTDIESDGSVCHSTDQKMNNFTGSIDISTRPTDETLDSSAPSTSITNTCSFCNNTTDKVSCVLDKLYDTGGNFADFSPTLDSFFLYNMDTQCKVRLGEIGDSVSSGGEKYI